MTSEPTPERAYVWVWLPRATEPVVAGVIEAVDDLLYFTYGRSYLARPDAIALYLPELPLGSGRIRPPGGLRVAGCLHDAMPDAWGRRVILHRLLGRADRNTDIDAFGMLTYLLESGSDRFGAVDFQASAQDYVARTSAGSLDELVDAARRVDDGERFFPALEAALAAGSSMGGARPKVVLDRDGGQLIAKLSSRGDAYPVVKAEGVAMDLAGRVGLGVAGTSVVECLGHDVLLVERFDRTSQVGERRLTVSALTVLGLDDQTARFATYHELADIIRSRFTDPTRTLRELFSRIVFNICVGNHDDHARNHAAFWDGELLTLTPAYDICPQTRAGGEVAQQMEIGRDGFRASQLAGCVRAADVYLLDASDARAIIDGQLEVIHDQWDAAADAARLTAAERQQLWGRQILNRYALEDY